MRISDWSSDVCSSDLQLLADVLRTTLCVVLPLPLCNHQRRQRIADDVECGACHVEDAVDAGDEREAFERDADAAEGGEQHAEREARYAGDTFRRTPQCRTEGKRVGIECVSTCR